MHSSINYHTVTQAPLYVPLGLFSPNAMAFTNTEALESKEEDMPIKFVEMSRTESSPDSKRLSTFKPEESTHL